MTSPERKLLVTLARVVLWRVLNERSSGDEKDIAAIKKLVGMIQRKAAIERSQGD